MQIHTGGRLASTDQRRRLPAATAPPRGAQPRHDAAREHQPAGEGDPQCRLEGSGLEGPAMDGGERRVAVGPHGGLRRKGHGVTDPRQRRHEGRNDGVDGRDERLVRHRDRRERTGQPPVGDGPGGVHRFGRVDAPRPPGQGGEGDEEPRGDTPPEHAPPSREWLVQPRSEGWPLVVGTRGRSIQ